MVDDIHKTLQLQDRFTIALSGGGTPKKLHLLLASDPFKNRIDWQKLHVFWGDERYVPFTDDRNNAKMAFDTLLDHVPVPKSQIHIMRTDIDPVDSANEYESILIEYFPGAASFTPQVASSEPTHDSRLTTHGSKSSTFDLVLLGLGDNSHTLSLCFPVKKLFMKRSLGAIGFCKRNKYAADHFNCSHCQSFKSYCIFSKRTGQSRCSVSYSF
jgi:6-phosphogluconolactonase